MKKYMKIIALNLFCVGVLHSAHNVIDRIEVVATALVEQVEENNRQIAAFDQTIQDLENQLTEALLQEYMAKNELEYYKARNTPQAVQQRVLESRASLRSALGDFDRFLRIQEQDHSDSDNNDFSDEEDL